MARSRLGKSRLFKFGRPIFALVFIAVYSGLGHDENTVADAHQPPERLSKLANSHIPSN